MAQEARVREALSSPAALVLLTLLSYRLGLWLRDRTHGHPAAQPVVVGIAGTSMGALVGGVYAAGKFVNRKRHRSAKV